MAETKTHNVTMKGAPVTLIGKDVQVDQPAPNCTLIANDLSSMTIESLKGKKVILSVVPSLDTPVCDLQTKRFNQEAANLGDNVQIITISKDLPFAQKRWCGAQENNQVQTLSDYKSGAFGRAYGVLIDGLELLTRAIFIIDEKGDIRYKQIVSEITDEPNYEEVVTQIKNL